MAESQSMTTAEVVAKTLIDEHSDFLAEAVALVARELMEAEISTEIGARHGEVSEERQTHRNGYRPRGWETRVGEIALAVPRKRSGEAYFPSFLEPRRPCEQAIVSGATSRRNRSPWSSRTRARRSGRRWFSCRRDEEPTRSYTTSCDLTDVRSAQIVHFAQFGTLLGTLDACNPGRRLLVRAGRFDPHMANPPHLVRWTDHALVKADMLGVARSDIEDAVMDGHDQRARNPGAAQWRVRGGDS